MLLSQNDPFREFDAFFRGGRANPSQTTMPMDAYRRGDDVWVHIDLPGVSADEVEIDVERSVLTVSAGRTWNREDGDTVLLSERPSGQFRRQVHLGDSLDIENIEADFADGVLTIRIPVSAKAKPRKISVGVNTATSPAIDVESANVS